MKKIICVLSVLLLSASAYSKSLNKSEISHCSGHFDDSFKTLNLDFYYTSPRVGSAVLLRLDEGAEISASYSVVAVENMNFDKISYELSFRGGFSLGEVRLTKNTMTSEYEFLIYNGNLEKVTKLNCN